MWTTGFEMYGAMQTFVLPKSCQHGVVLHALKMLPAIVTETSVKRFPTSKNHFNCNLDRESFIAKHWQQLKNCTIICKCQMSLIN